MKLSDQQRKILGAIELDAEKPIKEVAREAKLKTTNAQRILSLLIEQKVIAGKTAIIDVTRLGVIEYGLAISLEGNDPNIQERVISELMRSRRVSWIAEVGSEYDLMFNV